MLNRKSCYYKKVPSRIVCEIDRLSSQYDSCKSYKSLLILSGVFACSDFFYIIDENLIGKKRPRSKSPGKGKGKKTPEPHLPKKDWSTLKKRGEEDNDNKYIGKNVMLVLYCSPN